MSAGIDYKTGNESILTLLARLKNKFPDSKAGDYYDMFEGPITRSPAKPFLMDQLYDTLKAHEKDIWAKNDVVIRQGKIALFQMMKFNDYLPQLDKEPGFKADMWCDLHDIMVAAGFRVPDEVKSSYEQAKRDRDTRKYGERVTPTTAVPTVVPTPSPTKTSPPSPPTSVALKTTPAKAATVSTPAPAKAAGPGPVAATQPSPMSPEMQMKYAQYMKMMMDHHQAQMSQSQGAPSSTPAAQKEAVATPNVNDMKSYYDKMQQDMAQFTQMMSQQIAPSFVDGAQAPPPISGGPALDLMDKMSGLFGMIQRDETGKATDDEDEEEETDARKEALKTLQGKDEKAMVLMFNIGFLEFVRHLSTARKHRFPVLEHLQKYAEQYLSKEAFVDTFLKAFQKLEEDQKKFLDLVTPVPSVPKTGSTLSAAEKRAEGEKWLKESRDPLDTLFNNVKTIPMLANLEKLAGIAATEGAETTCVHLYQNLLKQPESLVVIWRHILKLRSTSKNIRLLKQGMIRDCSDYASNILASILPSLPIDPQTGQPRPGSVDLTSILLNATDIMSRPKNRKALMKLAGNFDKDGGKGFDTALDFSGGFTSPDVIRTLRKTAADTAPTDTSTAAATTTATPAATTTAATGTTPASATATASSSKTTN